MIKIRCFELFKKIETKKSNELSLQIARLIFIKTGKRLICFQPILKSNSTYFMLNNFLYTMNIKKFTTRGQWEVGEPTKFPLGSVNSSIY